MSELKLWIWRETMVLASLRNNLLTVALQTSHNCWIQGYSGSQINRHTEIPYCCLLITWPPLMINTNMGMRCCIDTMMHYLLVCIRFLRDEVFRVFLFSQIFWLEQNFKIKLKFLFWKFEMAIPSRSKFDELSLRPGVFWDVSIIYRIQNPGNNVTFKLWHNAHNRDLYIHVLKITPKIPVKLRGHPPNMATPIGNEMNFQQQQV